MKFQSSLLVLGFASTTFATSLSIEKVILNKLEGDSLLQGKSKQCGPIVDMGELATAGGSSSGKLIESEVCQGAGKHTKTLTYHNKKGYCSGYYHDDLELPCCCSDNYQDRELGFKIPSDAGEECPLTNLRITVDTTESCNENGERMECCESCKCFGDPHCRTKIGNKQVSDSFILCDIRDSYTGESDCGPAAGKKVLKDKKYKKRCEGAPGYEFNTGNCEWVPDIVGKKKYSFNKHGSPCRPTKEYAESHPMHLKTLSNGVKISTTVGERGVMKKIYLEQTKPSAQSGGGKLILNAEVTCGAFCSEGNPNCKDFSNDGIEFEGLKIKPSRQISVLSTGESAVDNYFNIQRETSRNGIETLAKIQCFGNTVSTDTLKLMSKDEAAMYKYETPEGGMSTRTNTQTRLDITLFDQFGSRGTGEGWCETGKFAEYKGVFGSEEDPFENCEFPQKLGKDDFKYLTTRDDCKALLEKNNCGGYFGEDHELTGSEKSRENFKKLMRQCVEYQCSSYNYDIVPGFPSAPPGSDFDECVSDAMDFGSAFVHSIYNANYQSDNDECRRKIMVSIPGFEDFEIVNGVFETALSKEQQDKLAGGHVKIYQTVCPTDCGHAKKLKASVFMSTLCYDLQTIVSNEDVKVLIGGKEVDLSVYKQHTGEMKYQEKILF